MSSLHEKDAQACETKRIMIIKVCFFFGLDSSSLEKREWNSSSILIFITGFEYSQRCVKLEMDLFTYSTLILLSIHPKLWDWFGNIGFLMHLLSRSLEGIKDTFGLKCIHTLRDLWQRGRCQQPLHLFDTRRQDQNVLMVKRCWKMWRWHYFQTRAC